MNEQDKRELMLKAAVQFKGVWPKDEHNYIVTGDKLNKSWFGRFDTHYSKDVNDLWIFVCTRAKYEAFIDSLFEGAPEWQNEHHEHISTGEVVIIPRPRKQEVAVDEVVKQAENKIDEILWNSGHILPPIGIECLFDCTANGKVCGNAQGVVKYMSEYTCVMDIGGSEFVAHPNTMKFRPLKTEAEKERERLHALLMKIFDANKAFKAEVVADSIIEAGWRPNDQSL